MNFSSEILFFFSLLGAFNGLLLGLYFLLFVKPRHISNTFLGILLIVLSVRIGKSVFFYFNPELAGIYLHIGITACFFIGPFLYFYVRSIVAPAKAIGHWWKYHLLLLLPIIIGVDVQFPYYDHLALWQTVFMNLIFLQWLLYLVAAGWLLRFLFKKLWKKGEKLKVIEKWVLNIYFGNVLIWLAYLSCSYTSYIAGALSFSFVSYLLILVLIFTKRKQAFVFPATKYADRKIDDTLANQLLDKLQELMEREELYKNSNLKSATVAKKIGISVHQLSQLLNDNLGKNFPYWVNEFRIKEAQRMISTEDRFSLEHVGYECGFNSKSTFFSTFKKFVGTTPARFKKKGPWRGGDGVKG